MKRMMMAVFGLALFAGIGCGNSSLSYRLVADKFGFSVALPEKPIEETSLNDEGLPQTSWTISHEQVVSKIYYHVQATTYKEVLNPDDELVPNEALLALNGIKMIENRRFKLIAKTTGRQVDAMTTISRETATGVTISSTYVVDGHNMFSISTRINDAGQAALFLGSLTLIR
jgi:hypothetical protein